MGKWDTEFYELPRHNQWLWMAWEKLREKQEGDQARKAKAQWGSQGHGRGRMKQIPRKPRKGKR
jgi:hypothetical protein